MPSRDRFSSPRRRGYVLLETALATGLLVLGLAVIGAQVQEADRAVHDMQLKMRAMMLAETQLAQLDLGLIEFESVDEVQEDEFGPRFPDFGWRLTLLETANPGLYLLQVDVLHWIREDLEEDFDFDAAETVYTLYAVRPTAAPVNIVEEFGLTEEEAAELSDKLDQLGIEDLSPDSFDPKILAQLDSEQLVEVLPVVMDAFGMDVSKFTASLPPDVLEELKKLGIIPSEEGEGGASNAPSNPSGGRANSPSNPTGRQGQPQPPEEEVAE